MTTPRPDVHKKGNRSALLEERFMTTEEHTIREAIAQKIFAASAPAFTLDEARAIAERINLTATTQVGEQDEIEEMRAIAEKYDLDPVRDMIGPATINATIERCAQWHDEQEKLFRMRAVETLKEPCPLPDVSFAQDQVADFHKQSAAAIRRLKDVP